MTPNRPGRNDPCPCGSGRKYKACCLKADRKAREAGAGGVPLTSEMLERVRREDVWQAELLPVPVSLGDDPGARPALALVAAGEWVVWAELHRRPSGDPAEVAGLLADAVLAAADRIGGVPSRLEVRHAEVVDALEARLVSRGVEVALARRLNPLDILAADLIEDGYGPSPGPLPPRRPCTSSAETWAGWALPEAVVAELFDAAASFHRARPWLGLDDGAPLSVETRDGRVWAASVLGAADIERGLSLYSDPEDRDRVLDAPGWLPSPDAFNGRSLCLSFNRSGDLPSAMRREVMRAGWTVVSPEAYPHLFTINTPGGGVSDADARDLVAGLRAVASGSSELAEAWARGGDAEWRDPDTGARVRLGPTPVRAGRWDEDDPTIPRILPAHSTVHRIRLELAGVEPPVWRRFEVPSDLPLWALHEVIQAAMGWEDYHLYSFEAGGLAYGEPDPDGWLDYEDVAVPLSDVARRRDAELTYLYDFGDDWTHELRVEAVEPAEPGVRYPRCLDGERACPPEDCGGVWGYEELLHAVRDPGSDEAEQWIAWAGEDFDPEAFDVDEANHRLEEWTEGPTLDPACDARFEAVMDLLEDAVFEDDLSVVLVNGASALLYDYALADPDGFLSGRKLEILAAGSLHAAGMRLDTSGGGERPTLEELAEGWNVSTASISSRSLAIRELVPRSTGFDLLLAAVSDHMQRVSEHLGSLGADPHAVLAAAGFRAPPGPFDPDDLAGFVELAEPDARSLRAALQRGLDRDRESRGWTHADVRPLMDRLQDGSAFGAGLREVLGGDDTPPAARDALARWVLSRLATAESPSSGVVPTSSLLALSHLAARQVLRGQALASALTMALALAPGPAEGLKAEDVGPLLRAVGSDEELQDNENAALLADLVERTEWGRDGREGPALVSLIAAEEAVPEKVRREVLALVGGVDDPAPASYDAGPATRRRALVLRGRMEERPETLVPTLLDLAIDDDVPALAAAELLESHGSALSGDAVEALVRQGLGHEHAPVRQAFFRAGRALLGDHVADWAPEDVLARARREVGRSSGPADPDQTTLF